MRTPVHLWVVGVLSLLWNAGGAYDYLMTNIRDPGYIANFSAETIQMIDEFPLWMTAAWAFGVWGSVAGSLLLLLRSRFAAHAFILSLAGLAVGTIYQATLDIPAEMKTLGMSVFNLAIWAGAVVLLVYALRMRKCGVLR